MASVIVEFHDVPRGKVHDLQLPGFLSGDELVQALTKAYELPIDLADSTQTYLRAENPIALICGERTLEELGVSNGTSIYFEPR